MKKRYILLFFVAFLLIGIATAALWYVNQVYAVSTAPAQQFEIAPGQTSRDIAEHLAAQGFISNQNVMLLYVYTHNILFLPGTYTVPNSYTLPKLLEIFSKEQANELKLTIPEGYTRQQIAQLLPKFNLSPATFLTVTKADEGTLFPDTYNLSDKTTEQTLRDRMVDQYAKKTVDLTLDRNALILASIVEREAKNDTDRAVIAAIYRNRLKIGMALEADPTVQYAKYTDLGPAPLKDGQPNYWAPITKVDYTGVTSSYNTYLHAGLPPGPICNPGLKSLTAAVKPAQTDALYFFHAPDGRLITSNTLDEHNANKAKYLK